MSQLLNLLLHASILCIILGCAVDPSYEGIVSPSRESTWIPQEKPIYLIDESEVPPEGINCSEPMTLCSLIDFALKNNPQTAISWSQARAAAYSWESSKSLYYPQIDLQDSYTWQDLILDNPPTTTSQTTTDVIAISTPISDDSSETGFIGGISQVILQQITASYLLLDFGGRSAAIESTRQALIAANWVHNRVIQTVIYNVLQAYYQFIAAKSLVTAREEDLENAKKTLESASAQYEAGVNNIVDFLQAKASYFNAKLQLEVQVGQLKISLGQLLTTVGLPANQTLDVTGIPDDIPIHLVSQNLDQLICIAKQERPDLDAFYANYYQKAADYKVAYSAIFPTLTANGIASRTDNLTFSNQNQNYYAAIVTLNFPIFSGFFYDNQIRKAYEDMETAYANILNAEEQVFLEVVTSYYSYQTAVQALQSSQEFLIYAQEAFNATSVGYQSGTNTIVDVLNTQAALSNAKTSTIQSKTQWAIALSNIAYSAGFLSDSF